MFFIWDDRNEEHIGEHSVEVHEVEYVVRHAKRPYPRRISREKWLVRGRTLGGRPIQAVYVLRRAHEIDARVLTLAEREALQQGEAAVYVVHARDLRPGERS